MSFKHWSAAAAVAIGLSCAAQAAGIPGQGTWETTLQPRELDGNAVNGPEAFYDTVLDITWLRNANLNGTMTWYDAMTWAGTLVVGGVGGWRLPTVSPVNGTSFQQYDDDWRNNGSTDIGFAKTGVGWGKASELGHLYYVTLGNKGYCTPNDASPDSCVVQSGWGLANTGRFENLQSSGYWDGTEWKEEEEVGGAWDFSFNGGQSAHGKHTAFYAMAVRPGDVVPEPKTYAMLLLGMGAVLLAVRRRPR